MTLVQSSVSKQQVLELARAVSKAGERATFIDADNSVIKNDDGTVQRASIEEAVRSGEPFFVYPKPNLAVFDLDREDSDDPEWLVELGKRFSGVVGRELGVKPLLVNSGRSMHLYVYSPGGANQIYDHAEAFGLPRSCFRGGKGVRPPLSPHRLGLEVGLVDATVSEAVALLGPVDVPPKLPSWVLSTLRDGDSGRFGGNRSNMALALASAFKSVGWRFEDFSAVMLDRSNAGGAKAHALEDEGKDPHEFLRRTWDRAETYSDGFDQETIDGLRASVLSSAWPGLAGATRRAVMLALIEEADQRQSTVVTIDQRTLAERSQVSRMTVQKALKWLEGERWLTIVPGGGPKQACGYRLRCCNSIPLTTVPHSNQWAKVATLTGVLSHPVFRSGKGLGKNSGLIWSRLTEAPKTRGDLATALSLNPATVSRNLGKLEEVGLARRERGGWVREGDHELLNEVSDEIGASEAAENQMKTHDLERMLYDYRFDRHEQSEPVDPTTEERRTEEDRLLMSMV